MFATLYAAQVQDPVVATVSFLPLFAMAKIDVVKGTGQVQGTGDNIRCHFNCPKRQTVCTKLGHLNL